MVKKKTLTVPQDGTQPSSIPSPIDNMFSGNTPKVSAKADAPVKKRPTSFNIDNTLIRQFKAVCATQGKTMSKVLEDFITTYISEK
ncbi:MAG: hypothetical protein NC453_19545 [Muribaculum sp.]|nr:hypothetical protein [Muribaculum sp.]